MHFTKAYDSVRREAFYNILIEFRRRLAEKLDWKELKELEETIWALCFSTENGDTCKHLLTYLLHGEESFLRS
jgi:hypothetical protein